MTASMTAFASNEFLLAIGKLTIEIRSVNHRYLDLNFRLPHILSPLEPDLTVMIKKRLGRGKVDINMTLALNDLDEAPEINENLVKKLRDLYHRMGEMSLEVAPIDFLQLLKWPQLLKQKNVDIKTCKADIIAGLSDCVSALITCRTKEGDALGGLIKQRLAQCRSYINIINDAYPKQVLLQKKKLQDKLKEAVQLLDEKRIEQEIVIVAQKLDISEEVDRLTTHIHAFENILSSQGQIGRRMDFLLQEMNREANTMASKAIDAKIQHAAVEIKVLLEQIREQVQNIE